MKLPNFEADTELNLLRAAMGAELRDYSAAPSPDVLTIEEVERLAGEGIEIPLDDVRVLNDGTHVYKGRRVIVYIRDVAEYGARISMPKYHLAMCDTLNKMIEEGRYKNGTWSRQGMMANSAFKESAGIRSSRLKNPWMCVSSVLTN